MTFLHQSNEMKFFFVFIALFFSKSDAQDANAISTLLSSMGNFGSPNGGNSIGPNIFSPQVTFAPPTLRPTTAPIAIPIQCCAVSKLDKVICGYPGITQGACQGMDCCYKEPTPTDSVSCFRPIQNCVTTTTQAPTTTTARSLASPQPAQTNPTQGLICQDDAEFCGRLSRFCKDMNPSFNIVRERCKVSCEICKKGDVLQAPSGGGGIAASGGILGPSAPGTTKYPPNQCIDEFPATCNRTFIISMCHHEDHKDELKKYCRKTCNVCPCVDNATYCDEFKDACFNPQFEERMKACPVTCNTCHLYGPNFVPKELATGPIVQQLRPQGGLSFDNCRDKHQSCPQNIEFCDFDSKYSATMREQCPVTCGSCVPPFLQSGGIGPSFLYNPIITRPPTTTPAPTTTAFNIREPLPGICMDLYDTCAGQERFCYDPLAQAQFQQACPYTCGQCRIPPASEGCKDFYPACSRNSRYCSGDVLSEEFKQVCPETCNICSRQIFDGGFFIQTTTTTQAPTTTREPFYGECSDIPNCKGQEALCNGASKINMKTLCPIMCGYCSPPPYVGDCTDSPVCIGNKPLCTDAQNKDNMKTLCPVLCGYCTPASSSASRSIQSGSIPASAPACVDRNPQTCNLLKNECGNSDVRLNCAKTCGLCGSVPTPITVTVKPPAPTQGLTPPPTAKCEDIDSMCEMVTPSLCNNPMYKPMLETGCRKSCGWCTPATAAPATIPPTLPPTSQASCSDSNKNCPQMTSWCNQERVKKACPLSCDVCDEYWTPPTPRPVSTTRNPPQVDIIPKSGNCEDEDDEEICKEIFERNLCGSAVFQNKCERTCGVCVVTPPPPQNDALECKDILPQENCETIKKEGSCGSDLFNSNCMKTCGICVVPAEVCEDTHSEKDCFTIEKSGSCKFSNFGQGCRKTCGLCGVSTSVCFDKLKPNECQRIKDANACDNAIFNQDCKQTCNICTVRIRVPPTLPPTTTTTTTTSSTTTVGDTTCRDVFQASNCKQIKDLGSCDDKVFKGSCNKTCGHCPVVETPAVCRDALQGCETYTHLCNSSGNFKKACQKTCGFCKSSDTPSAPRTAASIATTKTTVVPDTPQTGCKDSSSACKNLLTFCSNSKVAEQCPESCGKCPLQPTVEPTTTTLATTIAAIIGESCTDTAPFCAEVSKNMCTNPQTKSTMEEGCRKTCGLCSTPRQATVTQPPATITVPPTTTIVPPTEALAEETCEDTDALCAQVTADMCNNPNYKTLLHNGCKKSCGLCKVNAANPTGSTTTIPPTTSAPTTTIAPVVDDTCVDTAPFCGKVTITMCKVPATKATLEEGCPKTCGVCTPLTQAIATTTAPPTTVTMPPVTTVAIDESCKDSDELCAEATLEDCTNPLYKEIVQKECKKTCGLCGAASTSTQPPATTTQALTTTVQPTKSTSGCKDAAPGCAALSSFCATERVQKECPETCNVCEGAPTTLVPTTTVASTTASTTTQPPPPTTTPTVTTIYTSATRQVPSQRNCRDSMNCTTFVDYCKREEDYDVMSQFCRATCGFCSQAPVPATTTVPPTTMPTTLAQILDVKPTDDCKDTIPQCAQATPEICNNPEYRMVLQANCKKSCRLCKQNAPTPPTTQPPPVTTTVRVVPTKSSPPPPTTPTIICKEPTACTNLTPRMCSDPITFKHCKVLCHPKCRQVEATSRSFTTRVIPTERTTVTVSPFTEKDVVFTWSDWTLCSKTCGGGSQSRTGKCDSPGCTLIEEKALCNQQDCPPKPPRKAIYSKWSLCSVTCGRGVITRTTLCFESETDCVPERQEAPCRAPPCSVTTVPPPQPPPFDGNLRMLVSVKREFDYYFDDWGPCSTVCGLGEKTRTARCAKKSGCKDTWDTECIQGIMYCNEASLASRMRKQCPDTCGLCQQEGCSDTVEVQECYPGACAGGEDKVLLHKWSDWTDCSKTCGTGVKRRTGTCQVADCDTLVEELSCNTQACPIPPRDKCKDMISCDNLSDEYCSTPDMQELCPEKCNVPCENEDGGSSTAKVVVVNVRRPMPKSNP